MWTVTYIGTVGPALAVTSLVIRNVTRVDYDWDAMIVQFYHDGDTVVTGTLTGITTVTTTVATKSITIS